MVSADKFLHFTLMLVYVKNTPQSITCMGILTTYFTANKKQTSGIHYEKIRIMPDMCNEEKIFTYNFIILFPSAFKPKLRAETCHWFKTCETYWITLLKLNWPFSFYTFKFYFRRRKSLCKLKPASYYWISTAWFS